MNEPPSRLHWNEATPEPPLPSSPLKVNVALLLLDGLGGLAVMVVSGGVVSSATSKT